ncbi:hypothetical protein NQ317_016227 [Molorchus minor]|uniref:aspartate transaminase n=1 Tax=Molorchus minor TaxID=1323400 RepID=A0ABQ9IVG8_9CUCU|nr:hypothetical protein NQ317_016227 [Molorchus minor]
MLLVNQDDRLRDALEGLETPGDWSHFTEQYGMFSFTGLNDVQCQNMIKKYHIHMLLSGRISICGVSPSNIDYIAKAIYETVTDFP